MVKEVKRFNLRWLSLGLIFATAIILLLDFPPPLPQFVGFLLIAIWPMLTWSRLFSSDWLERLLIGGSVALLLNMLWALLLSYFLINDSVWLRLIGPVLIACGPLLKTAVLPTDDISFTKREWEYIVFLFLLVCGLRIFNLSYSEFQGDEGVIMVRAASILTGDNTELFLHQKGPVEILLPISLWGLTDTINEFWTRILFAWAGIISVGSVIAVARRWFGTSAGITAGYLFAIVGFSIAFSRIVQYQSLVMLWGAMALLMAIRYIKTEKLKDLIWSALFLAAGLLAHYDAILVAPAIGWLLIAHVIKTKRIYWSHWMMATIVGTAVLAAFYIPFITNPNFGRTGQYLLGARIGVSESTGIFSWSGPAFWQMVTLYNSTYFILGLALLVIFGIWVSFRSYRNVPAVLYFVIPFIFYLFIVVDPRTHVYTAFPGAAILGALALQTGWNWLKQRSLPATIVFATCVVVWFAISTVYVYLIFVDHSPERVRTWAENRPAGYWKTWEEPPEFGLFGFPHQAGWRDVGASLSEDSFPYASNEEEEITNWYMKQAARTHCLDYKTFLLAADVQDEIPYDVSHLNSYSLAQQFEINGRDSLQIYTQNDVSAIQPISVSGDALWVSPEEVAPPMATGADFVEKILGDEHVNLLGYDLELENAYPGGEVVVTLYWKALRPFTENYQVFVHLYGDDLVGQHDGSPECNIMPTTRWEPGQVIVDPHIIPIAEDSPLGELRVVTGMYNLITQERLQVAGNDDNLIELTSIRIEEATE